jgi:hypothetical protein
VVVVADINTLWRRRPFEALSEMRPVLGLQPMDRLIAVKQRRFPLGATRSLQRNMTFLSIVLPFSWATRRATEALPGLWKAALKKCRSLGADPSALVVTSPHYASLVEQVSAGIPTFYYCSDDYSNYSGWDANKMREQEAFIVRHARHSFFVSAALRDRAMREYGIDPSRVSISMNATDEEFLLPVPTPEIDRLVASFPALKRPIVGVIGGITGRLDFELLVKVADSHAVGSVLFVGGIEKHFRNPALDALGANCKCVFVGHQPRESLPTWCQGLDVGLIPFRHCDFNTMCSPLRLFDHLATGRSIVATDACPQVCEFQDCVAVASNNAEFLAKVKLAMSAPAESSYLQLMRKRAPEHTWAARALVLNSRIETQTIS